MSVYSAETSIWYNTEVLVEISGESKATITATQASTSIISIAVGRIRRSYVFFFSLDIGYKGMLNALFSRQVAKFIHSPVGGNKCVLAHMNLSNCIRLFGHIDPLRKRDSHYLNVNGSRCSILPI